MDQSKGTAFIDDYNTKRDTLMREKKIGEEKIITANQLAQDIYRLLTTNGNQFVIETKKRELNNILYP